MIGTPMPCVRARLTSAPWSASTSMRLPCCRSISSDDRVVGGSASAYARTRAGTSGVTGTPSARATACDLATRADEQVARLLVLPERADRQPRRAGESGERRQVDELLPERHARVGHGLGLDPGIREECREAWRPWRRPPPARRTPRRTRCGGASPSARSRPGPRSPSRCTRRRRARASRPTIAATSDGLSTPFCSVSTIVSGAVSGRSIGSAVSLS